MSIRDPSSKAEGCLTSARGGHRQRFTTNDVVIDPQRPVLDRCDDIATGDRDRCYECRPRAPVANLFKLGWRRSLALRP